MYEPNNIFYFAQHFDGTLHCHSFAKANLTGDIFSIWEKSEVHKTSTRRGALVFLIHFENDAGSVAKEQRVIDETQSGGQLLYCVVVAGEEYERRTTVRDLLKCCFLQTSDKYAYAHNLTIKSTNTCVM